jgi:hypothetical protein
VHASCTITGHHVMTVGLRHGGGHAEILHVHTLDFRRAALYGALSRLDAKCLRHVLSLCCDLLCPSFADSEVLMNP